MKELGDFLNSSRKEYDLDELKEDSASGSPFDQFGLWMDYAIQMQINEPNALTLSTVSQDNRPTSRIVLLRAFDEHGFVFYTNYNSRKGSDLASNPYAAMNFFWPDLHRQIRIEGVIEKVPNEVSDRYFLSRPRESRIGAWVSDQSGLLDSRETLEVKYESMLREFEGKEIPRPPHWGGFRLYPSLFEFWQGRTSRLHDRITYSRNEKNGWNIQRLYP
ncbi:MAG: pyridoxamine 5'-phosphate oxidase [Bacteroidota bacterium]|jgi:pyridoxamine 5'-phosphate oxidase